MIDKPMRWQTADPGRMRCRDCIYRDQAKVEINGEIVRVGITRDTCLVFDGKGGRWKPGSVYFQGEDCPFYELDETAEKFWKKGKSK